MSQISISSPRKSEQFDINGGMTVRQALGKFYACQDANVERELAGQTVRLNASNVEVPGGLSTPLRDRDFVSIYTQDVARGGVKGAL